MEKSLHSIMWRWSDAEIRVGMLHTALIVHKTTMPKFKIFGIVVKGFLSFFLRCLWGIINFKTPLGKFFGLLAILTF